LGIRDRQTTFPCFPCVLWGHEKKKLRSQEAEKRKKEEEKKRETGREEAKVKKTDKE
jgi:hypothetical protein